jgi:hypothetical protein
VGRSAYDHRVNGGTTAATGGVTTTLCMGRVPAREEMRWSTKGR